MKSRFALSEITLNRVLSAIVRRILNVGNLLTWKFSSSTIRLEKLEDSKKRVCVVICNGPSLSKIDIGLVKNIDCFSMNRAYLSFDDWGFVPKYHTCINSRVLTEFSDDLASVKSQKFYNRAEKKHFDSNNDINFLYLRLRGADEVVNDISQGFSSGGTVTFVSIQLALLMGYKKIVIVGMDHSFNNVGTPNAKAKMTTEDQNHYRPDYFPIGMNWDYPDLRRSELAYKKLKEYADSNDSEIVDCSVGGKCDVFRKSELRLEIQDLAIR